MKRLIFVLLAILAPVSVMATSSEITRADTARVSDGKKLDVGHATIDTTKTPLIQIPGSSSGTISVKGAAAAGTWTFTLPTGAGTSDYLLRTDGSGTTSWVQAMLYDAELSALGGLTSAADKLPYFTGSGTAALADFTAAGRALVDDAAASDQRTTLGLGTMATQNSNNVSITGGTISGVTLPATDLSVLSDTARLDIRDTTIVTMNGKRVLKGKLTDDAWNCVNPTFAGATFNCSGSYDRFRALEKSNSIHTTRSAQAAADSGSQWPIYWQAQITTNGDSFVVYDRAVGKVFAVLLKQANGACGNFAFNDFDVKDSVIRIATNGAGLCEWDYLADRITRISTAGVRTHGNSQTRNSTAQDSTLITTSLTVQSNAVTTVASVRGPFGKTDALGRLSHWWATTMSSVGLWTVFNPDANATYHRASSSFSYWTRLLPSGVWAHSWVNNPASLAVHRSIFSVIANSAGESFQLRNTGFGGSDVAWAGSASTMPKFALIDKASIAGSNSPIIVAAGDSGAYFYHTFMAGTPVNTKQDTAGVKIRLHSSYIGAPEFGDCVLAWSGASSVDGSPYTNALTNKNSPVYKTPSSTVVFSGAYSYYGHSGNSYLIRTGDTDFALGTGNWYVSLWFKSVSATNPAAIQYIAQLQDSGAAAHRILFYFNTTGTLEADVISTATNSVVTTADLYDGNWHHAVVTQDGSTITLFVDGVSASTVTVTHGTLANIERISLGATVGGANNFTGLLSNCSVGKTGITVTQARWLSSRGPASLLVEQTQRKLPALDVDYVQSLGSSVVMGNQDSCRIWDASLALPSSRYFVSPGGNIQDATLDGAGPDSLSLSIVTTTKTQIIEPNPRIIDVANNRSPFVQPAVNDQVLVDSAGVRGIFWQVDDAFDAGYNAGVTHIKIMRGTYAPFTIDHPGLTVEGSGFNPGSGTNAVDYVTNIRATGSSAAITYTNIGYYTTLMNLNAYTAPGGGGGGYDAISMPVNTNEVKLFNVSVSGSDDDCIDMVGGASQYIGLWLSACDGWGIKFTTGQNNVFNDSQIKDAVSGSISAGALNNVCDGNKLDGAVTGTCAGTNETTAW